VLLGLHYNGLHYDGRSNTVKLRTLPRHRLGEENLIPLINIVFLLLIFFMLAGRLTPPDSLVIEPPQTQGEPAPESAALVLLLAADGRLALAERVFTLEQLETELGPLLAVKPKPLITLKADATLSATQFLDVLEALRALGVEQLTLLSVARG